MNRPVRNTTKSRTIQSFADAGISIVTNGKPYFTKGELVAEMTKDSLSHKAPVAMRTMFEAEAANLLDTYFKDVAEAISQEIALPYHFTSKEFHRNEAMPQSEAETASFVVCFGNGRRGKAYGLRFVTAEDDPDPMMLLATQKSMDVVKKALETQVQRLRKLSSNPALPMDSRLKLREQLPPLLEAAKAVEEEAVSA